MRRERVVGDGNRVALVPYERARRAPSGSAESVLAEPRVEFRSGAVKPADLVRLVKPLDNE